MKRYVAYYRVSTQQQEESGLGIEAQKEQVESKVGKSSVIKEFVEVESGKKSNRPVLKEALAFAKKHHATLIVAKLDRLSREVRFIFELRESQVDFECLDIPDMNTLTLGMFAIMAQYEREKISQRVKDALKAKKDRGDVLGKHGEDLKKIQEIGSEANRIKAQERERTVFAFIETIRKQGKISLRAIAKKVNDAGFLTAQGKAYHAQQISNIINR